MTNIAVCKFRRFKYDGLGGFLDFGILPAHYARDADGVFRITDQQIVFGEFVRLIIQCDHLLARFCAPDNDLVAADVCRVKRVHGLAGLQHHKVGDVDDVVDGTDTCLAQAQAHPVGGWRNCHIGYSGGNIARAQVNVLHCDADHVCRFHVCFHIVGFRFGKHGVIGGGGFARNAHDAQAVGTVCANFKFNDCARELQQFHNIRSRGGLPLQNQYAVHARAHKVGLGQVQFLARAQHAKRFNAAQFAFFDRPRRELCHRARHGDVRALKHVGRTGYNLQQFTFANI